MRQFVPLTDDEFELMLMRGQLDQIKPYQPGVLSCHREFEEAPPLPDPAPTERWWWKVA
ncbi:MAG: hypothetical protein KDI71_15985 [Xanthomonadales bacterium]|nr:hypothetical protein [Xanthomonadales bacterium]